jgi:hypothetical protein
VIDDHAFHLTVSFNLLRNALPFSTAPGLNIRVSTDLPQATRGLRKAWRLADYVLGEACRRAEEARQLTRTDVADYRHEDEAPSR